MGIVRYLLRLRVCFNEQESGQFSKADVEAARTEAIHVINNCFLPTSKNDIAGYDQVKPKSLG